MSLENSYVLRGKIVSVQPPDTTLTISGAPADAKTVGDLLRNGGVIGVSPEISAHLLREDNPHKVTKKDVGLSNVDNTADMEKPVSRPQQEAISKIGDGLTGKVNEHEEALKTKVSNSLLINGHDLRADFNLTAKDVGAAGKRTLNVTLAARDWVNKRITVAVEIVGEDSDIIVTPDKDSFVDYADCMIRPGLQSDGELQFLCSETPDRDIVLNLMVFDPKEVEA